MTLPYTISKIYFENDETCWQMISLSWIKLFGEISLCYWPPKLNDLERLVKVCAQRNENSWLEFSCEIIEKFGDYYLITSD